MNIQVEVMSRDQVENYIPSDGEVCISIRSYNPNHPMPIDSSRKINLSDKFDDVLHLQFDDVDLSRYDYPYSEFGWTPLTKEQANEVNEFVQKHIHDKKKLIVHCWGGVSRSRSMAAAIVKRYSLGEPFQVYNKWVYDLVMKS